MKVTKIQICISFFCKFLLLSNVNAQQQNQEHDIQFDQMAGGQSSNHSIRSHRREQFSPPMNTCFSSKSSVEVKGIGSITMDQLKIGDHVRSGMNGLYTEVYGFAHFDHEQVVEFLQIYSDQNQEDGQPLEISSRHYIFVERNHNVVAVPASDVVIGDILNDGKVVQNIDTVIRRGVYAPLTQTGDILVNGIRASNYIQILDKNIGWNQPTLGHALYFPQRLFCKYFMNTCKQETYINGYSYLAYILVHVASIINAFGWFGNIILVLLSAPIMITVSRKRIAN